DRQIAFRHLMCSQPCIFDSQVSLTLCNELAYNLDGLPPGGQDRGKRAWGWAQEGVGVLMPMTGSRWRSRAVALAAAIAASLFAPVANALEPTRTVEF